jgi:hypothetical protein
MAEILAFEARVVQFSTTVETMASPPCHSNLESKPP